MVLGDAQAIESRLVMLRGPILPQCSLVMQPISFESVTNSKIERLWQSCPCGTICYDFPQSQSDRDASDRLCEGSGSAWQTDEGLSFSLFSSLPSLFFLHDTHSIASLSTLPSCIHLKLFNSITAHSIPSEVGKYPPTFSADLDLKAKSLEIQESIYRDNSQHMLYCPYSWTRRPAVSGTRRQCMGGYFFRVP